MDPEEDFTVLSDSTMQPGPSHRETAGVLLGLLEEEMTEDDFHVDLMYDLQEVIVMGVLEEMKVNILGEDWYGAGFKEPSDVLCASEVADYIGDTAKFYFQDDQTGKKSADVMQVLLEYAEEYDIVE